MPTSAEAAVPFCHGVVAQNNVLAFDPDFLELCEAGDSPAGEATDVRGFVVVAHDEVDVAVQLGENRIQFGRPTMKTEVSKMVYRV